MQTCSSGDSHFPGRAESLKEHTWRRVSRQGRDSGLSGRGGRGSVDGPEPLRWCRCSWQAATWLWGWTWDSLGSHLLEGCWTLESYPLWHWWNFSGKTAGVLVKIPGGSGPLVCPKPSLEGRHHRVFPRLRWVTRHRSREKKAHCLGDGSSLLLNVVPTSLSGKRKRLQAPAPVSQSRSDNRTRGWET